MPWSVGVGAKALALARRSGPPLLRGLSTLYIELIRGVPLVSVRRKSLMS